MRAVTRPGTLQPPPIHWIERSLVFSIVTVAHTTSPSLIDARSRSSRSVTPSVTPDAVTAGVPEGAEGASAREPQATRSRDIRRRALTLVLTPVAGKGSALLDVRLGRLRAGVMRLRELDDRHSVNARELHDPVPRRQDDLRVLGHVRPRLEHDLAEARGLQLAHERAQLIDLRRRQVRRVQDHDAAVLEVVGGDLERQDRGLYAPRGRRGRLRPVIARGGR